MPKMIAIMPVKRIEKLQPPIGRHTKIAVAPSLYLHLSPTGGRSWVYRFTVAGKKIDRGIGSYTELSRDEAMAKVAQLRDGRRSGIDPATRKSLAAVVRAPTFREATTDFHKANAGTWSKSHADAWLQEMEREVMPAIGDMAVDKIEVADVLRALAGWTERHDTVSRCRGRIEKVLDACKAQKQRTGENPAAWKGNLASILPSPKSIKGKEKAHHAAMPFGAIAEFVAQLPDSDAGRALEFLILTATRSNETRDAVWDEFDLEAATWTIPAERMKAGLTHTVPLCARALAILEAMRISGQPDPKLSERVFDIGRDDMIDIIKTAGDYTTHGMRAAFSTWAGELTNHPRDVVERCLAHVTGDSSERDYRRGAEVERRRIVMDAWAHFVATGNKQNIVVLDNRRA